MHRSYRTDSQLSNLDAYGTRIKRGSVIEFPGGATARVSRVRLGRFTTDAVRHTSGTPCARVKVLTP